MWICLAGGDWPARAREAAIGLAANPEENDPIRALLLDIRVVFAAAGGDRIFSRTLVEGASARQGKGKEVTDRWLAEQLHPLGIRPRTIRIGGAVAKGYVEEDFTEAFKRYISRSEIEPFLAEAHEQRAEDGEQKSEVSNQKSEGSDRKTEIGDQKPEVSGPQPEGQQPEAGDQRKDESGGTEGGEAAAA